jgi:hypothetical protein
MYTIFFTINCVEQLIFSKTFVDHLQFEQLIFFCLKVKLLKSSSSPKINWIRAIDKKNIIARTVSSNNKIVSSRFFEQSNFEQMIMTVGNVFRLPIRQNKFFGTIEFFVSILDLNIQICRPFVPCKISHISL